MAASQKVQRRSMQYISILWIRWELLVFASWANLKVLHAGLWAILFCSGNWSKNVHRSCSVIWSDVGFVCPARSFGVDKVCLSQYLDCLFAYFLLGPSEMLVSGHSIFQCSSWGQSKNSMCWCSCQLAYNLLHSFQLSSWGWVWMVLGILMLFLSFDCTAGELKTISKSSGAIYFVSRFWLIPLLPVVVFLFIGFLKWPIAVAAGRCFCADMVFQSSLLGVGK
jgi:hypothetical protein